MSDYDDEKRDLTVEERLARLENIAFKLCGEVTDTDYSWQSWADPLKAYMKEIEEERKKEKPR